LAIALIYEGGSRSDAARFASVTLQIVRDWVVKFNDLGPDGLIDCKAPGPSLKLKPDQWQRLAELIDAGPIPAVDGVVCSRLVGSTCGNTGFQTGSSNLTMTFLITVPILGANSPITLGGPCPSDCGIGRMRTDQMELV
jgi:hypothetical protein